MVATAAEPKTEAVPHAPTTVVVEPRVVIDGVSWETYERLVADRGDRSSPRLTYVRGVLEIVSPTQPHEASNRTLQHLVLIAVEEIGGDLLDVGSMTFKRASLSVAFEPDTAFYIEREPVVRDRGQVDLAIDPPPDLIIEVDVTSSSLNELPLFAELGVPEVWRVVQGRVFIHRLVGAAYDQGSASAAFPWMTSDALTDLLTRRTSMRYMAWVKAVRAWVREQSKSETA